MGPWDLLEKDRKNLEVYRSQMVEGNVSDAFTDSYKYVKNVTNAYSAHSFYHPAYVCLVKELYSMEAEFGYQKIIDVPVDFRFYEEKGGFLEMLVHHVRRALICEHNLPEDIDITKYDYTGDCKKAMGYVSCICSSDNIPCTDIVFYPGYDKSALLCCGAGFHCASIIKYNGKHYLIDVTYPQFFWLGRNNLERLGIVNFFGCASGTFMLMSEKGKQVATKLLKDGYIELTDEVLKIYLDSFTVSFRNGLYYENTNDFSFTTPYTIEDYVRFLKGEDNQVNHEGKENLGFQGRPLKNPELVFKPKL